MEVEFFLQTLPIRAPIFGEVVDYTGLLPFRYLQSKPVEDGQLSFFDPERDSDDDFTRED